MVRSCKTFNESIVAKAMSVNPALVLIYWKSVRISTTGG